MPTFVIDTDNAITAYPASEAIPVDQFTQFAPRFSSEKELAKIAAQWPTSRLVEIWNTFAGAPPFGNLKPVKKFTDRQIAIARIWNAVQALTPAAAPQVAPRAPKKAKAAKKAKAKNDATGRKQTRAGSKKAIVLELLKRPKGATLKEIMSVTQWLPHSVRGFVSGALTKKMGLKIESFKNSDGERAYRVAMS